MAKIRIDKLLMDLNLVSSLERGRALIMASKVLVDEVAVTKAGTLINSKAALRIKEKESSFVSRGGIKLSGALDDFGINVSEKTILDVGASTGGFTDCCLQRGSKQIYAVDVGTNQLAYSIRRDPRVLCLEKTNARSIEPSMFSSLADIAVIDVSFISITKLLKATISCLVSDGEVIAMVKPQFELSKDKVEKGGIVTNREDRYLAVKIVTDFAIALGLKLKGQTESKIKGPKGNLEIFIHLKKVE